MRWDLTYCPECGFGLNPSETILYKDGESILVTTARLLHKELFCCFKDISLDSIRMVKQKKARFIKLFGCELEVEGLVCGTIYCSSKEKSRELTEILSKLCNLI